MSEQLQDLASDRAEEIKALKAVIASLVHDQDVANDVRRRLWIQMVGFTEELIRLRDQLKPAPDKRFQP